jgi:hypothetical protein
MFYDANAWPPPPDGSGPLPPPEPRLTRAQERTLARLVGVFLLTLLLGPLAGSSVVVGVVALLRSIG